jgi:hypothetical protein
MHHESDARIVDQHARAAASSSSGCATQTCARYDPRGPLLLPIAKRVRSGFPQYLDNFAASRLACPVRAPNGMSHWRWFSALALVVVPAAGGCGSTAENSSVDDGGTGTGGSGGGTGGSGGAAGDSGAATGGAGGDIGSGGAGGSSGASGSGGAGGNPDGGSGGGSGTGGSAGAEAGAPACPDHAPRLPHYPYTPEGCPVEALSAQLRCEYDTTYSDAGVVCRTTFVCHCLSNHMGGIDCWWNADMTVCPDAGG